MSGRVPFAPDKAVVPLSDPAKPAIIKAGVLRGSITVKAYEGKEVIVEAAMRGQKIGDDEKSGGKYADLSGLPDLIDSIVGRVASRATAAPPERTVRLYDFTLLFLAFAAFLTGEWLLRRSWQLH